MLKKQRLQLLALGTFPLVFILFACVYVFEPKGILIFHRIAYLLGFGTILLLFLPIRLHRIGGVKSSKPFLIWIFQIMLVEALFVILFLGQYTCLSLIFSSSLNIKTTDMISTSFWYLGNNLVLFPWFLIIFLAVIFAYVSQRLNTATPMVDKLIQSFRWRHFKAKSLELIVTYNFRLSTRFFLALQIVFVVMTVNLLFVKNIQSTLFLFAGFITVLFSLVLLVRSRTQDFFKRAQARQFSVGWILVVWLFVYTIITLLIYMLLSWLYHNFHQPIPKIPSSDWFSSFLFDPKLMWQLSNSSWWVLALPILATLLVRLSKGRYVLSFIFTGLLLPILMLMTIRIFSLQLLLIDPRVLLIVFLVVSFVLLFLLCRQNNDWAELGYFPQRSLSKYHYSAFQQLSLFILVVFSLIMLNGFQWLTYLTCLGASLSLIIWWLFSVSCLKR